MDCPADVPGYESTGIEVPVNINGCTVKVDRGIKDFIEKVNKHGFQTLVSCSGLREDHPNFSSAYVCFKAGDKKYPEAPKHNFPPEIITPSIIDLSNKIRNAGWIFEFDRSLDYPSVCARMIPSSIFKADFLLYGKKYEELNEQEQQVVEIIDELEYYIPDNIKKELWNRLEHQLVGEE